MFEPPKNGVGFGFGFEILILSNINSNLNPKIRKTKIQTSKTRFLGFDRLIRRLKIILKLN